jgi:hypothetical protein
MMSLLEQRTPAATTEDTLYTVPAGFSVGLASVTICNTSGAARTFRLAIVKGGGATATASYVFYDLALPAATTREWCHAQPVALGGGDAIRIYASGTGVAFGAFGTKEAA